MIGWEGSALRRMKLDATRAVEMTSGESGGAQTRNEDDVGKSVQVWL